MKTALRPYIGPDLGDPQSLAEAVEEEVRRMRASSAGNAVRGFIADQLERLAQLIRWTGAATPEDHIDRMETWDQEIRSQHFDRGYEAGFAAGREGP